MSAEAVVVAEVAALLRSDASCAPPLGPWQALQKRQRIKTRMMDRLCMCAPARGGGRSSAALLGTVDTNLGGAQFEVGGVIRGEVAGWLVDGWWGECEIKCVSRVNFCGLASFSIAHGASPRYVPALVVQRLLRHLVD